MVSAAMAASKQHGSSPSQFSVDHSLDARIGLAAPPVEAGAAPVVEVSG
jgi:hypothetical protein